MKVSGPRGVLEVYKGWAGLWFWYFIYISSKKVFPICCWCIRAACFQQKFTIFNTFQRFFTVGDGNSSAYFHIDATLSSSYWCSHFLVVHSSHTKRHPRILYVHLKSMKHYNRTHRKYFTRRRKFLKWRNTIVNSNSNL